MKIEKDSAEQISLKYGFYVFISLVIFFFAMKLLNLVHVVELRALNGVFMVSGIILAFKKFKESHGHHMNYLQGMGIGVMTSTIAVVPFAVFVLFFLLSNNDFMLMIKENEYFGRHLNPYILSFIIAFEGIFSGLIMTFTIMQYVKEGRLKNING
jgi:hypothetical protein